MRDVSIDAPEVAAPGEQQQAGVSVELVMDSHRVTGRMRVNGIPRRLVDVLNSVDAVFIVVNDGQLDDPFIEDGPANTFETIQVQINSILFAIPRSGPPAATSAFETVTKVPVAATIVLPGFEVTGNIHLLPDTDPAHTPMLGGRRFVPMTDVTIVPSHGRNRTWREQIVVVNLARAVLYAPNDRPR